MPRLILPVVIVTLVLSWQSHAQAQLFGKRNLGASSLSRRSGPGGSTDAGSVTGNERFIRGNRSRRAFVGSDAQEIRSFVGSEQATVTGQVQSTTAGLRPPPDRSATLNKPIPPQPANARYYPRLKVGFDYTPDEERYAPPVVAKRLEDSEALRSLGVIEVSLAGQTATLRGEVVSESDRKLAALIVSFEPGIAHVHNDLIVNTALQAPPTPPEPGLQP